MLYITLNGRPFPNVRFSYTYNVKIIITIQKRQNENNYVFFLVGA